MARDSETQIVVTSKDKTDFTAPKRKAEAFSRDVAKAARRAGDTIQRETKSSLSKVGQSFSETGKSAAGKLGGALKAGVAAGAVAAGAAIVGLGTKALEQFDASVKAASDLGESVNAVGVVFEGSGNKILRWGEKNAAAYGLSKAQFNSFAVPVGALMKNLGLGLAEVSTKTVELGKRASDLASIYNLDVAMAQEKIIAGLKGEYDGLDELGITMTEAMVTQQGLTETGKKSADQLTEQEKVRARYNLIMKQSSDAEGDAIKTGDSYANTLKRQAAETENLRAEIGDKLIPVALAWERAKMRVATALSEHLGPAIDKAIAGGKQLWEAFQRGSDGFKGVSDALSDVRPQLEWLGEQGGKVFVGLIKAAETYGKYVAGAIEAWIRGIGLAVDAYLWLKENVSGALRATLQSWQAAVDGVYTAVDQMLAGLHGYAAGMDAVFKTNTADALASVRQNFKATMASVSDQLDNGISMLGGWQRQAQSDRNEIKIKDTIAEKQARIRGLKRQLQDPSLTKTRRVKIEADIAGEQAKIRKLQAQIDRMRGKTIYINVRERLGAGARKLGRQEYAHGGITGSHAAEGGPRGNLTWVGEQGPELVRLPPGSMVHSNPDSERISSQTGTGGGRPIIVHQTIQIGDEVLARLILDPLSKAIQTNRGIRSEIRRAAG